MCFPDISLPHQFLVSRTNKILPCAVSCRAVRFDACLATTVYNYFTEVRMLASAYQQCPSYDVRMKFQNVRVTNTIWGPYREGQVSALNRVQKRAAKFANNKNESGWENLAQRRLIDRICAHYKAYIGRPAWKAIGDTAKAMLPAWGRS